MTLAITHSTVVVTPDDGTSEVGTNEWNAGHTISGLGTGVQTFLETPSSANLASALTDETGSGAAVFANTPTLVTPILGVAEGSSLALGVESSATGQLILRNSTNANITTVQAGAASASRTYTLPTNFGTPGTVLTDAGGDGTLSWAAGGGNSLAGSDRTWYVNAATGSDSNDGLTALTAFATIQHAVDVSVLYDYQHIYKPIILVADGSYPEDITLGQYFNLGPSANIFGNLTTPANVVISSITQPGDCAANTVTVNGFTLTAATSPNSSHFTVNSGTLVSDGLINFTSPASNFPTVFGIFNNSVFVGLGATFDLSGMTTISAITDMEYSTAIFSSATFIFPTLLAAFATIYADAYSTVQWGGVSYTNFAGLTGPVRITNFCNIKTDLGVITDFPGDTYFDDNTSKFHSFDTGANSFVVIQKAGAVALSDVNPQGWGIIKDSTKAEGLGIGLFTTDGSTLVPLAKSDTGVTAGSYVNTNLTVDAQGHITAAADGSGASESSTTDFYVATTGDNGNDGSIGSPWLTLQYAWDTVAATNFTASISSVNIHVADGTYGAFAGGAKKVGRIIVVGNLANPENCIIDMSVFSNSIGFSFSQDIHLQGFILDGTGGMAADEAIFAGEITSLQLKAIKWKNLGSDKWCLQAKFGAQVIIVDDFSIEGNCNGFVFVENASVVTDGLTACNMTLVSTPIWSVAFASIEDNGLFHVYSNTTPISFTGTATGRRFEVSDGGVIQTLTNDLNIFPGDQPGIIGAGGQYDIYGVVLIADSDLTFYVDPATGSDTNMGTLASPFKTIQYAINVAVQFEYNHTFSSTIQLAAGTYDDTNQGWSGPAALKLSVPKNATNATIIGDSGTPGNVILDMNGVCIQTLDGIARWVINGCHIKGPIFNAGSFGSLNLISNEIELVSGVGGGGPLIFVSPSGRFAIASTSISGTNTSGDYSSFVQAFGPLTDSDTLTTFFMNDIDFTISVDFTTGFFLDLSTSASALVNTAGITNPSNIIGPQFKLLNSSALSTDVEPSTFPGTTPGTIDQTSKWSNSNVGSGEFRFGFTIAQAISALPSAASVAPGDKAFVNDALVPVFGSSVASGGGVSVPVYSDGANWIVG